MCGGACSHSLVLFCMQFAVRLRHNSLLVMWEGCQEAWKHEVPKESHYTSHKISGALRVNLTFRRHDPEYVRKQPICCGVKREWCEVSLIKEL
ncbi:hypothetical protein SARC_01614 [Sphaeroforma arctica JP610]|uniref:Alpha-ketoglutarate-dependent dioxygenase AlkB-like domain-containing protein n=1 Tax=Sphaeroforma arctica JP610 TaxID=667725 RepID=A0A0L0GBF4_9EUKA|nr:hypothetical protein SARC_01614 [Sphaeroforma arctica JP610]KNC86239.1 hypothetical protein SARC_01614 [Sphaeroforma arctica JP610]|eukprot:XP_014160141.1 hypothetical protein SARC_01614 [Sphaeroforma arctica JP610]